MFSYLFSQQHDNNNGELTFSKSLTLGGVQCQCLRNRLPSAISLLVFLSRLTNIVTVIHILCDLLRLAVTRKRVFVT